jgi:hypothetical protein
MYLRVGYHGRCFDGCSSAALFTRFYTEAIHPGATVTYRPLAHQKGAAITDDLLDGDENAVLDFKYTSSPRLTWWFDHHQSAFSSPEQRAHFLADTSGRKHFDPACSSCTKLIHDVTTARFSHAYPGLEELIRWADIIDAARFPDAAMATELREPALRLMTVIEASDDAFCDTLVPRLAAEGLAVVDSPAVRERFQPLWEAHQVTVERVRERAQFRDGAVFFDLTAWPMDGFNKFIGYYLHPEANYSVGLTASPRRAKISVGSNPWTQSRRSHDLAAVCERYGGGGHPAVGAVTLPAGDVEEARRIGREIVEELRR